MIDYTKIFADIWERRAELAKEQARIETEVEKLSRMLNATFHMMPPEEKKEFSAAFKSLQIQDKGLTAAVKQILKTNRQEWLTAVQVRDKLKEVGFDFGGYTSNPLVSVHSVLKRLKPREVQAKILVDGTKEYRWNKKEAVINRFLKEKEKEE